MLVLRAFLGSILFLGAVSPTSAEEKFKPVQTQFIAALADPTAKSGDNAETWGLWIDDPGPRGVRLGNFSALLANDSVAPAKWKFDKARWWLDENGLIMEEPPQKLAPGKYLVTGDRATRTTLTVFPKDASGKQRWELADGASVYDVTHLRCRSAVYTAEAGKVCTPSNVNGDLFRVAPGAAMPDVPGCNRQDYAVIFIVGVTG
jgi:hypothetical protein